MENPDLYEMLTWKPEEALITQQGSRVLLISTGALGTLRRELIETLGVDRARGVLVRHGYYRGQRNAQRVASQYDSREGREWLMAGPHMHSVKGMVHSIPLHIEFDREEGRFYYEGVWENSYEGKEHLRHFGMSDSPTCWTLTGFASGFASTVWGEPVICKEVECIGKGDSQCTPILKPAADWEDDVRQTIEDLKPLDLNKEMDRLISEQERAMFHQAINDAKLKALQSQMNPHFLFNTLNVIARLALIEGAQKTEQVTYALADLLRHTLDRMDQAVTLEEELRHVKHYLEIQGVRFGDRVNVKLDVAECCLDTQLPLLTLQPLVENAFIHGLEPSERAGELLLRVAQDGDDVVILVQDNGVGMVPERLAEIDSHAAPDAEAGHTTQIGIGNVRKRLDHYSGGRSRFEITSAPAKGTRICIRLPCGMQLNEPFDEPGKGM